MLEKPSKQTVLLPTTMEDPMSKQNTAGGAAFLKQQRKRLTALGTQLLSAGTSRTAERAPKTREAREIEDDAQALAQNEVDENVDAVEEHRLRAIERALAKIDEGTYGLSDLSGDPIPKGRLEAMPEAVLTIQEEEARERQQRR
jgi:DnaK suppressor protein